MQVTWSMYNPGINQKQKKYHQGKVLFCEHSKEEINFFFKFPKRKKYEDGQAEGSVAGGL